MKAELVTGTYYGLTHMVPMWALGLWSRFMCKRNVHCFDEVWTIGSLLPANDHTMYCDACGLTVQVIDIVEEPDES